MSSVEASPEQIMLLDRLRSFVGHDSGAKRSQDPVNKAMIRHWCVALGDHNPAYLDDEAARAAGHDDIIAPPAMVQAWTMPDFGAKPGGTDAVGELYALLDSHGYSAIVATNSEQQYFEPVRIGDRLTSTKVISDISDEKKTALGAGYFVTSIVTTVNQDGTKVAEQLHRVLKFKPADKQPPKQKVQRPRPNVTQDTAFFFEGAKQRKLLIQGCDVCGRLQHPPTAACSVCGSLKLSPRQMSGRATLFSYTIVHAPAIAPFEPPYPVILATLEEGPRIVSEIHGVPLDGIKIGMPIEVDFLDDGDFSLPIFRTGKHADA
jgi:uncharacterized OB-fold protein/acyl dehydratase